MPTLKLVVKHAGSSLVSKLLPVENWDHADAEIADFLSFWRELPVEKDTGWHDRDDVPHRDITTIPAEDEYHWLFRFTFLPLGVVPELATAPVATRVNAGSSPVHASTHSLERTSPKGTPFRGTCRKCGMTDLDVGGALEPCDNPRGLSFIDSLEEAIQG